MDVAYNRNVEYTINGFYKSHILVFAEVVSVELELSTDKLVVVPQIGLPAEAGSFICVCVYIYVYVYIYIYNIYIYIYKLIHCFIS